MKNKMEIKMKDKMKDKMKIKKNLFSFTLLLAICCTMVSCDSDRKYSSEDIAGKWSVVSAVGYSLDLKNPTDDEEWDNIYSRGEIVFMFNENGRYTVTEDGVVEEKGKWRIKDNKLYMVSDDEDPNDDPTGVSAFKILKLTANDLVIDIRVKEEYSEYYNKIIMERTK